MSLRQSITKFFKISLLFLFIGFYSGITLFYHVHIVNGKAIVHSHFYKSDSNNKTPFKKHSHPQFAYDVIHELNKINSDGIPVDMPYKQPLLIAHPISYFYEKSIIFHSLLSHLPSRAPPTC